MKTKYTNLQKSYMYGGSNRKNDYFHKCVNLTNDIDDPIYTGFTFSIDNLYSPLFFSNYDGVENIGQKIEDYLGSVWGKIIDGTKSQFDIEARLVKDEFDNETKIGYGLQENVYAEELLYGAIDYIYMVDKNYNGPSVNINDRYTDKVVSTPKESETISENSNKGDSSDSGSSDSGSSDSGSSDSGSGDSDSITSPTTTTSDSSTESTVSDSSEESPQIDTDVDSKKLQEIDDKIKEIKAKAKECSSEDKSVYKEKEKIKNEYNRKLNELNAQKAEKEELIKSISDTTASLQSIQNDAVAATLNDNEGLNGVYVKYTEFVDQIILKLNVNSDKKTVKSQWPSISDKKLTDEACKILGTSVDSESTLSSCNQRINELSDKIYKSADGEEKSLYDKYKDATSTDNLNEYEQLQLEYKSLKKERDLLLGVNNTVVETSEPSKNEETEQTLDTDVEVTEETENGESNDDIDTPQSIIDLYGFITDFNRVVEEYPYLLVSVEGLDTAYQKQYRIPDSYLGGGNDLITISCYETLDMKISAMFNKYLNAVYDRQYKRERVPVNLRRFNCSIFVHDIRNFRSALSRMNHSKFGENGDNASTSKIIEVALNYLSVVEFKFFECEFVPESCGNIFGELNDEEMGSPLKTSFAFRYGNCVVNYLPFGDLYQNYNGNASSITPSLTVTSQSDLKNVSDMSSGTVDGKSYKYKYGYDGNNKNDEDVKEYVDNLNKIQSITDNNEHMYFDRSPLGNVTNNDKYEYVTEDSTTAVDFMYKNDYVNCFAENSMADMIREQNARHRAIVAISASTGEPVSGVSDMLNIGYLNAGYNSGPVCNDLGSIQSDVSESANVSDIGVVDSGDVGDYSATITDLGMVY